MANVALNNIDHGDLRVTIRHGAEFGDAVNQVMVLPTEFAEVQREYPIFLRRDPDDGYRAVALLGLDRGENLFLDEAGWQARYVPAMQRRGPFLIGFADRRADGGREPMVFVDPEHPRIARDGTGEPLFLPHGGNAPYLDHVTQLLRVLHVGAEVAGPMYAAWDALGLIEPVTVQATLSETERYELPQFHSIARDRLAALDGPALEGLHREGYLEAAFNVLASLANVSRLIDLKNRARDGG